eukprot:12089434-Alexandrium_andersonii.AAC.1
MEATGVCVHPTCGEGEVGGVTIQLVGTGAIRTGLGWRGVRMCDLLCSSSDRRRGQEAPGANERAAHAQNQ